MPRLSLYLPVKPFHLNQSFAGNLPCVEDRSDIPLSDRKVIGSDSNTTCLVGYVKLYPLMGMPNGHTGADLMAGEQPICSSLEGIVTGNVIDSARGLGIEVTSEQTYSLDELGEFQVKLRYWHLKSFGRSVGQRVKVGDILGISDTTGFSAGNHVHWELKPVVKDTTGNYVNAFPNNGFFGAIDPMRFCNMQNAVDVEVENIKAQLGILQKLLVLIKQLLGIE